MLARSKMKNPIITTLKFPSIDTLRALAVTMVIVLHVIEIGGWKQFPISWPLFYFRIGLLGVDLFFVISGFVITWSAISLISSTSAYYKNFFINRLARIVPLYVLTCLIFLVIFRSEFFKKTQYEWITDILLHATFLHNLSQRTAGSLNGVTWSLGLEVQFYLFSILLTPLFVRIGAIKTLISLLSFAWIYKFLITLLLIPGTADAQLQVFFTSFQLPGTIDEFSFGIAAAILLNEKEDLLKKIRSINFYATSFIILGVFTFMVSVKILQLSGPYWSTTSIIVFWRTLTAASFGLLLLWAISYDHHPLLRPISFIGMISYGMYLWHLIILKVLITESELRGFDLMLATFSATLFVSYLSWRYFEIPAMNFIKNKYGTLSKAR